MIVPSRLFFSKTRGGALDEDVVALKGSVSSSRFSPYVHASLGGCTLSLLPSPLSRGVSIGGTSLVALHSPGLPRKKPSELGNSFEGVGCVGVTRHVCCMFSPRFVHHCEQAAVLRFFGALCFAVSSAVLRCFLRCASLSPPLCFAVSFAVLPAVLHCAALRFAVLRCASLCYAASSAVLRCASLRCAVLRFAALRFAVLRCASLRFAALRCASLRFAVLCCAVLCCAVLCCAVLCCAVLCCAVLCCACCAVLW